MADLRNKALVGVVTAALISGISLWEGYRPTTYEDVVGVLTVCYGQTGKVAIKGKTYTRAECDAFLQKEVKVYQEQVYRCVNQPMTINQFNAFTMFTYNMGATNFCNSGFLREFNKGNTEIACKRMATHPDGKPGWSHADGKYFQGLQNRRQFERDMCLGK